MKKLILIIGFILLFSLKATADTQTFTSSDTWTCPAGVTSVDAECWAGGGGAGGAGGATEDGVGDTKYKGGNGAAGGTFRGGGGGGGAGDANDGGNASAGTGGAGGAEGGGAGSNEDTGDGTICGGGAGGEYNGNTIYNGARGKVILTWEAAAAAAAQLISVNEN